MLRNVNTIGLALAVLGAAGWLGGMPVRAAAALDYATYDQAVNALRYDPEASSRMRAAQALGRLGDARAIEALVRALETDPEKDVRAFAAVALGEIGSRAALPALKRAANNDPSRDVQRAALRAISRIEGRPVQVPPPPVAPVPGIQPILINRVTVQTHALQAGAGGVVVTGVRRVDDRRPLSVPPPRPSTPRTRLTMEERERTRQVLLYYYWPDGRPRKYYAGSAYTRPAIYPTPGGQAPLDLLQGTGGSRRTGGGIGAGGHNSGSPNPLGASVQPRFTLQRRDLR